MNQAAFTVKLQGYRNASHPFFSAPKSWMDDFSAEFPHGSSFEIAEKFVVEANASMAARFPEKFDEFQLIVSEAY